LIVPEPQATQVKKLSRPEDSDILLPKYDPAIQSWTTPFIMSFINTRVVRKSVALYDKYQKSYNSRAPLIYREVAKVPNAFVAFAMWLALAIALVLGYFSLSRRVLQWFLPKQGEGPSPQLRAKSWFRYTLLGFGDKDNKGERKVLIKATVTGGDPGYGETAKMLGECGLLLALERDKLPAVQAGVSGVLTPATAYGTLLIDRLNAQGILFTVTQ